MLVLSFPEMMMNPPQMNRDLKERNEDIDAAFGMIYSIIRLNKKDKFDTTKVQVRMKNV